MKKKKEFKTPVWIVIMEQRDDLANVHVGSRINDIDLDVWPVLGVTQPAQHPRILGEEMLSKKGEQARE